MVGLNVVSPGGNLVKISDTNLSGGAASSLASSTFASTYPYLLIVFHHGAISGAGNRPRFRFNGDSGNNYSYRIADNNGAGGTATSADAAVLGLSTTTPGILIADVVNFASVKRRVIGQHLTGTDAAATAVLCCEAWALWASTDGITSVTALTGDATTFGTDTRMIIYGHY